MQEAFSLKAVSEYLSVHSNTIGSWERALGLEVNRDENNRKFYSHEMIDVLEKIKGLRDENLSYEEIKSILEQDALQKQESKAKEKYVEDSWKLIEESDIQALDREAQSCCNGGCNKAQPESIEEPEYVSRITKMLRDVLNRLDKLEAKIEQKPWWQIWG